MCIHENIKVKFCKVIVKSLNSKCLSHIGGEEEKRRGQRRRGRKNRVGVGMTRRHLVS
jgi:hypothetical protein